MKRDDVERKLRKGLDELVKRDGFLLFNDVNERSVSHKLAEYLQVEFQQWNVDCEYNRDGLEDTKRLSLDFGLPQTSANDTNATTVYPDIVVHKRGTADNLLVIEVKKESNPVGNAFDIRKLQAFVKQLGYRHAVSITLLGSRNKDKRYDLRWVRGED